MLGSALYYKLSSLSGSHSGLRNGREPTENYRHFSEIDIASDKPVTPDCHENNRMEFEIHS